jgi:ribosomal-protein-alanine N-acetyltransferase
VGVDARAPVAVGRSVSPAQRRGVTVRVAVAADLPAVMLIEQASFTDPWSLQAYRELLTAPYALFQIAEDASGTIVGHAVSYFAADEAELGTIAVAEEARRRGAGWALLGAAIAACRDRAAAHLYLEVRASNASAQAMYQRAGFVEVGRRRGYYNHPVEDAIVMRCEIAAAG